MKNYVYIFCLSMGAAVNALPAPFCCYTKAMVAAPQAKSFEQQLGLLQSQCADNPGQLANLAQHAIAQREQALENGKQRQQNLEQLHVQLNDENNDSQDHVSTDAILKSAAGDMFFVPSIMRDSVYAQYDHAYDQCYPESTTCAYEKAYLAYLCAKAAGYANGVREQEIEKLRSLTR